MAHFANSTGGSIIVQRDDLAVWVRSFGLDLVYLISYRHSCLCYEVIGDYGKVG